MLSATGLGRRIDGGWIWRDLDLEVRAGDRVALVGPSGSGKTLLLRALAALDPLDEGSVALDGRPLDTWEAPRYRASVTYLPQRADLAEGSVESNLRAPFAFRVHAEKRYDRETALRLLEALGRDGAFLDKESEALSGGERQVAALVRVLLLEPRILLLDEPAASMDEALARRSEGLVRAWMEDHPERALVWTSHRTDRVDRVATRRVEL